MIPGLDSSSWENFSTPVKACMDKGVFELVNELSDGFKNGEDGVWAWVQYNITEHNLAQAPPNMAMMAQMKSNQQVNMLKNAYQV